MVVCLTEPWMSRPSKDGVALAGRGVGVPLVHGGSQVGSAEVRTTRATGQGYVVHAFDAIPAVWDGHPLVGADDRGLGDV